MLYTIETQITQKNNATITENSHWLQQHYPTMKKLIHKLLSSINRQRTRHPKSGSASASSRFCCERFQSYYETGFVNEGPGTPTRELYPNIKIIKLNEGPYVGDKPYRFLIVCGFLRDKPPAIYIGYCPFCGMDLFTFYKNDDYINEHEDTFWR